MVVPSNCAWGVRSLESIRTEDRCNHPGILSNYGGELWLLQMSYGCGLELLRKKISPILFVAPMEPDLESPWPKILCRWEQDKLFQRENFAVGRMCGPLPVRHWMRISDQITEFLNKYCTWHVICSLMFDCKRWAKHSLSLCSLESLTVVSLIKVRWSFWLLELLKPKILFMTYIFN